MILKTRFKNHYFSSLKIIYFDSCKNPIASRFIFVNF